MKKIILSAAIVALLSASSAFAEEKPVRIVGQVLAMTDSQITIKNRRGRTIELDRNAKTTVPSTVKVGDIVSIKAMLTATQVTAIPKKVKAAKTETKPAAAAPAAGN